MLFHRNMERHLQCFPLTLLIVRQSSLKDVMRLFHIPEVRRAARHVVCDFPRTRIARDMRASRLTAPETASRTRKVGITSRIRSWFPFRADLPREISGKISGTLP